TTEEGVVRVGDKARMFKVLKMPVPLELHPPEVQPLLGYEFFSVDETGKVRTWDQVFGAEAQRDFWMKLDDLAHDMYGLLCTLESGATEAPAPVAPDADKPAVYLAETTTDLKNEHEAIKRDLQQHGHRVLPAEPLPLVGDELKTAVQEAMAQCQLSIHLIGA